MTNKAFQYETKTWDEVNVDVQENIRLVREHLKKNDQIEAYDQLQFVHIAFESLSNKVRTQINNDHAADVYRRMMEEFKSNEVLMEMFTDLLATAKLYNSDFVNDLMAIDAKYGIGNK